MRTMSRSREIDELIRQQMKAASDDLFRHFLNINPQSPYAASGNFSYDFNDTQGTHPDTLLERFRINLQCFVCKKRVAQVEMTKVEDRLVYRFSVRCHGALEVVEVPVIVLDAGGKITLGEAFKPSTALEKKK